MKLFSIHLEILKHSWEWNELAKMGVDERGEDE